MKGLMAVLLACLSTGALAAAPAAKPAAPEARAMPIPTGKGLPVVVKTAVLFHGVESFDDNKGTFEATTDLRLSWVDTRLRYRPTSSRDAYHEYRGTAAEAEIAKIWTPVLRIANQVGEPSFSERRLRLMPDGTVEVIARTTAVYKTPVNLAAFPFDRQALQMELLVREDTVESVDLDFTSADVEFSRAARSVEIGGWSPGLVDLKRSLVAGWNGDRYAKVTATLAVERSVASTIATIFIPLFASLLIPFLATWMNKSEHGEFEVDAFELANVIIGGLFAVIALGFTVSSAFPAIVSTDNAVTRLLGLNYVALAVGLVITVVFYRYNLPRRWFGAYVQEEAFRFLTWGFPLLFILTGLAFLAAAAA